MGGRPGEAGFAPSELAGAPRRQWSANSAGEARDECDARDSGPGVRSVDSSQRCERRVVEPDAHSPN